MSTKTLRKRIALVAVSAMGFGLLTSVAANATAGTLAVTANGTSSTAASRGIVSINGSASTTSLSATTSTTSYMSVLNTGWVHITLGVGASNSGMTVSGGVFAVTANSDDTVNASSTSLTRSDTTSVSAIVKPSAGSTQSVVTAYTTSGLTTSAGVLTINWVSPATSGVFSSANSLFSVETTTYTTDSNVDATWTPSGGTASATSATIRTNSQSGYYSFYAKDGNGTDLVAPAVSASSTGGCLLNTSNSAGTISSAYSSSTSGYFRVDKPTANVPATCVVTISVNGTVASTRTFTFHGDVASIKIDYVKSVEAKAGSSAAALYASAYDSAGNSLDAISLSPVTAYYNANLTSVGTITTAPFSDGTVATDGGTSVTCNSTSKNKMQLATVNAVATTIKSPEFEITCSGDPVNYKASLDKSSYVPGDIATLTITATDSTGAAANSDAVMGTTTYPVSIAGSNMTAVGAISNADKFTAGKKTYKFIVGSTEGNYSMAVDLPYYNSTSYAQSAQTVPYTIKASTATVSNAEVLAAIVKLIASINKQIAALQKALTKKK